MPKRVYVVTFFDQHEIKRVIVVDKIDATLKTDGVLKKALFTHFEFQFPNLSTKVVQLIVDDVVDVFMKKGFLSVYPLSKSTKLSVSIVSEVVKSYPEKVSEENND